MYIGPIIYLDVNDVYHSGFTGLSLQSVILSGI